MSDHTSVTKPSLLKAAAAKRLRRQGLKRERANARLVNSKTPFNVRTTENGTPVKPQPGVKSGPREPNGGARP